MTLVSDALVTRLREWGVHRIFGYAGDGIDPVGGRIGAVGKGSGGGEDEEHRGSRPAEQRHNTT